MTQLDIFKDPYPCGPGYRDKDTSKAAAEAIAPSSEHYRQRVYCALTTPKTDWELAIATGLNFETVQPRRSEMGVDFGQDKTRLMRVNGEKADAFGRDRIQNDLRRYALLGAQSVGAHMPSREKGKRRASPLNV